MVFAGSFTLPPGSPVCMVPIMALPIESADFQDVVVVLGAAGLVIPAFAALRISPVVGFILFGMLAGPQLLGSQVGRFPWLAPFTISDAEALAAPAELGITLLLFALGLELSIERLRTMRRLVFGLGAAQLGVSALLLGLLLLPFGLGGAATLTLALALSLSSTAVGLQMLSASGRIGSEAGRTAFGILLLQDIAIAPLLLLLSAGSAGGGFLITLVEGVAVIAGIALAGRLLVPALFLQAARTRRPELFLAATLVVLLLAATAMVSIGLSPAIGGLVAGVVLAETDYRRQVEAAIAPFEGLLLGVFLIWVGMSLDLIALVARPLLFVGLVLAVVSVKAGVLYALLRGWRRGRGVAAHVAALLAAPGETSLILIGVAATMMTGDAADIALIVTGISLALAPVLGLAGQRMEARFGTADATVVAPEPVPDRTVIIGFGRVGRLVASMLEVHAQPYLAVDSDPDEVRRHRAAGQPVIYGDARRPELLAALHLESARAVVLTIDAAQSLETLVRLIRERHPDLCVVVRARDADHAAALYQLGASDAVPETIESSLQLAEALLADLGVPMGRVIASIHEKRAELRSRIQADGRTPRSRLAVPRSHRSEPVVKPKLP